VTAVFSVRIVNSIWAERPSFDFRQGKGIPLSFRIGSGARHAFLSYEFIYTFQGIKELVIYSKQCEH